jgi:Transcriptional regulator C-terminal region
VDIKEGKPLHEVVILRFIGGAYLEVVEWWFTNGMPYPPRVMAEQVGLLIERIV